MSRRPSDPNDRVASGCPVQSLLIMLPSLVRGCFKHFSISNQLPARQCPRLWVRSVPLCPQSVLLLLTNINYLHVNIGPGPHLTSQDGWNYSLGQSDSICSLLASNAQASWSSLSCLNKIKTPTPSAVCHALSLSRQLNCHQNNSCLFRLLEMFKHWLVVTPSPGLRGILFWEMVNFSHQLLIALGWYWGIFIFSAVLYNNIYYQNI